MDNQPEIAVVKNSLSQLAGVEFEENGEVLLTYAKLGIPKEMMNYHHHLVPTKTFEIATISDDLTVFGLADFVIWNEEAHPLLQSIDPIRHYIFCLSSTGSFYTLRNNSVCHCHHDGMHSNPPKSWWCHDYKIGILEFWTQSLTTPA